MSYTIPQPYNTKVDLNVSGAASAQYWSAIDANGIKTSISNTETYLNEVSSSANDMNNLFSRFVNSTGEWAPGSGTYIGYSELSGAVSGVVNSVNVGAYLTSTQWTPDGGTSYITGALTVGIGTLGAGYTALRVTSSDVIMDGLGKMQLFKSQTAGAGGASTILELNAYAENEVTPGVTRDGVRLRFNANDNTGNPRSVALIEGHVVDPAAATFSGKVSIHTAVSGNDASNEESVFRVVPEGIELSNITADNFGVGHVLTVSHWGSPNVSIAASSGALELTSSGAPMVLVASGGGVHFHQPNGTSRAVLYGPMVGDVTPDGIDDQVAGLGYNGNDSTGADTRIADIIGGFYSQDVAGLKLITNTYGGLTGSQGVITLDTAEVHLSASNPSGPTSLHVSGAITAYSAELSGALPSTLYMHSANGTRWAITIGNDGILSSSLA